MLVQEVGDHSQDSLLETLPVCCGWFLHTQGLVSWEPLGQLVWAKVVQWFPTAPTLLFFPAIFGNGFTTSLNKTLDEVDSGVFLKMSFYHFQTWEVSFHLLRRAQKGTSCTWNSFADLKKSGSWFAREIPAARVCVQTYRWVENKMKIVVQCYLNLAKSSGCHH